MALDINQQIKLIEEKIDKLNKEKEQRICDWFDFKIKEKAEFLEAFRNACRKENDEKQITQKVTATKIFTFDAAHYLEGHPGSCRRMHGHTYKLEVTFQKNPKMPVSDMNPPDMVMDFSEIKKVINEIIISKFDHQIINGVPEWMKLNLRPTAENMVEVFAKWIMKHNNGEYAGNLVSIRLWETPTSFATWTK